MKSEKRERGICELYQEDPERADALVFGRKTGPSRRGFLKGAGLAAMATVVGGSIPYHRNMLGGLIPAALAENTDDFVIPGKDGLRVLNDRPVNAETPAYLLTTTLHLTIDFSSETMGFHPPILQQRIGK